MRKVLSAVMIVGMVAAVGGCSKMKPEKKIVGPEELAGSLAGALCEKFAGCQPAPEFNKDQCLQQIAAGLTDRFKAKTELKVEKAMLDGCLNAIKAGGCEMLGSESAPAGCDFLN
jgi:hypothetical protein